MAFAFDMETIQISVKVSFLFSFEGTEFHTVVSDQLGAVIHSLTLKQPVAE